MIPFGFTVRACDTLKTLGYVVHGLLYAFIQKVGDHGHLKAMA